MTPQEELELDVLYSDLRNQAEAEHSIEDELVDSPEMSALLLLHAQCSPPMRRAAAAEVARFAVRFVAQKISENAQRDV